MKKKIFSIVFALVLVVSFSLVTAVPAGAQEVPNPTFATVDMDTGATPSTEISIGWERNPEPSIAGEGFSGTDAIHVTTSTATVDYAMVIVPTDFILTTDTTISHWGYTVSGDVKAPDEIYLFLDSDGDQIVDTLLASHKPGLAASAFYGTWDEWNSTDAANDWHIVVDQDPFYVDVSDAYYDGVYNGASVLAIALTAGPSTTSGPVSVDVYFDQLTVNGDMLLDEDTGTIDVPVPMPGFLAPSIQDAIDAALPDDTITVAAGTYAEAITIGTADLTLQSASKWGAIIRPTTTQTSYQEAAIRINADGVTIDGFEIDGTTVANNGICGWNTSGLTIKNNKIHGAVNAWDGCGILLMSWGDSGTVYDNLIEGNEVYDTGRMGIMVMDHDGSNYTVTSNNTITGNIVHDVWKVTWGDHGGGIQINVAKDCSITNNLIYDVRNSQRGIYMYGSAAGNTIEYNTIRNNPIGIQLWISGEGGGPIGWGSDAPTSPQVHYNNIYDNSEGAISTNKEGTPMDMDATNNWWGNASGPAHASNPGGTGNPVTDNVAYSPWLGATFDTSPMIFIVDDVGPEPDAGYIQTAIDAALPGGTISVAAGTYTEHLTITDKSNLTIQSTEDAEIVPTSTPWKTPIIKVDSSTDITIRGLVIDGKNEVDPQSYSWGATATGVGVVFIDSTGTIEGNEIRNFKLHSYPDGRRWKPIGTGIIVTGSCSQVTIEGNAIESYQASGIRLFYGADADIINADIINNVITGIGAQSWYSGESIRIDANGTVNIIGNELRDNIYNDEYGAEGEATGVTICGVHGLPVVNITENDILNNTFGIMVEKAEGAVVEAHFNNIEGNGVHGTAPNRGGAAAQDVLEGHGDPDVWPINTTLNATHNWWGNASGPYHATTNPAGQGDAVSGNVDFEPWFGAGVEDSRSEETEAGPDTIDAKTEADTEVIKSGAGTPTITVAKYSDNPGRGFAGDTGKYIDVHIDDPAGVTEIEIRVYYTDAEIGGLVESSLILRWWDGTRWVACSDTGVITTDIPGPPPYSGYIWAKIRNDTIPTLAQLSGTVFGGSGRAPTAPPPPPAPVPPPGTTDVRGMVSTAGIFLRLVTAISEDGLCTLTIPEGTVGLTEELEPLTEITIVEMDEPPPPPEGAYIIGLAYDFQPSGATFELPVTLKYTYDPADIPEGVAEEDLVLAFYIEGIPPEPGEWVVLDGCVVDPVADTVTAPVAHFTAFRAMVFIPAPAAFSLSGLGVSPAEVEIGSLVTISAVVENTGGEKGTCEVTLKINGKVEETKEVALDPGASETVTFITSRDVAGSYSVDANGLSGSFTVKELPELPPEEAPPEEAPPEAKPPISWPVIGGIIAAAVVVVGLGIFFLVRRRAY